jgi:soluble lytic murein transglycosylase-like protein
MASSRWIAGAAALRRVAAAVALAVAAPAGAQSVEHWNPHIEEASARFGIPPDWIRRVMSAESAGRTMLDGRPITSRAGAIGLMQLMPGTWRDMRAMLGLGTDPYEPRDNILAGAAYLRAMYDRFGYPGLFAAYNAGPARYAAFLSGARALPAETRSYVAAVAPLRPRKSAMGSPSPPRHLRPESQRSERRRGAASARASFGPIRGARRIAPLTAPWRGGGVGRRRTAGAGRWDQEDGVG